MKESEERAVKSCHRSRVLISLIEVW